MWGESKARRALVMAAVPAASLLASVSGVGAQPIFQPTFSDSQLCVTADMENALLQGANNYTPEVAVTLPAGTIRIPEAISYDEYEGRETTPAQTSERWELEFLNESGDVIATSDVAPDIPDLVRRGEWIGDLGSVTLTEPAVAVRAHHRTDLPLNTTPNSVHVSGVTLCWEDALTPEICIDDNGQQVDPNEDGTCPSDPAACLNPDGTPMTNEDGDPVTVDDGETCPEDPEVCLNSDGTPMTNEDGDPIAPAGDGTCPEPVTPQCVDSDGNTITPNEDGTCPSGIAPLCVDSDGNTQATEGDGSCPPAGPILPQCTSADGTAVEANTDGTCPEPEPAGPTITPQAPTTPEAPLTPAGDQLPITGSSTMIFVFSGMWLLAAGATATMFVRTRLAPSR